MRGAVIAVLVGAGLGATDAAAASCAPTALVVGPESVVAAVTRTLASRGIATAASDGCPFVRATIAITGAGLAVTIEDPSGRSHRHVLATTDLVATVIESWTSTREEAPLLAAHRESRPRASVAAVDVEMPHALDARVEPQAWLGGALALETSLGSDGSIWWGVAASACAHLGPLCVGAGARLASDARIVGDSERLETGRTALDGLLAVDVPIRWGGWRVTWGAGAGVGWSRSSFVRSTGDALANDQLGARADVQAVVELPITRTFAAVVGATIDGWIRPSMTS